MSDQHLQNCHKSYLCNQSGLFDVTHWFGNTTKKNLPPEESILPPIPTINWVIGNNQVYLGSSTELGTTVKVKLATLIPCSMRSRNNTKFSLVYNPATNRAILNLRVVILTSEASFWLRVCTKLCDSRVAMGLPVSFMDVLVDTVGRPEVHADNPSSKTT